MMVDCPYRRNGRLKIEAREDDVFVALCDSGLGGIHNSLLDAL